MKKKTTTEFTHKFGKMIKGKSSLLLEGGQLSDTQNMIPGYEWEQRKGMSALTSSAVATSLRFKSLCQFRTLDAVTDVLLAHTYDASGGEDLYQGSALPPNAITWTKKYDLTASCTKCQFANVSKAILVANTKDFLIWRGTSHFPTGVWKYTVANTAYTLFADELFDGDTSTSMSLNSLATGDEIIVLSDMPLDTVTVTMGNTNSTASKLLGFYWTGSWVAFTDENGTQSTGNLLVDDCSSLTNWDDDDAVNGVSSQTTFQGRQVFKFDSGASGAGTWAKRSQDVGSFANGGTVTMRIYIEDIGATTDVDHFQLQFGDGTNFVKIRMGSDGMFVYDGGSWVEIDTDIVSADTWQEWTFDADSSFATMNIYLDGTLQESGVDITNTEGNTDGDVIIAQNGQTTANRITYVDLIRVSDGGTETGDSFSDGTETSNACFGQSGDISWTKRTDEEQTTIESVPGYAYKFKAGVALDSSVTVTALKVHAPMGTVANIWNNQYVPPTGCYVLVSSVHTDYMAYVNNTVESQYMDLSGIDENDKIYIGFPQRVKKILFWMASDGQNTNNVSLTSVKYFNAAGAATSVGTVSDTTETGTAMFSQKGYFSWSPPAENAEKRTIIGGDEVPMFWYEIVIDDALVDPTYVYYIQGVPVTESIDPARGVFAFKRRAWQIAPRNKENMVRYSAQELPNTFNGSDSGYIAFGERPLVGAAPFYNETLLYADTEMWMLQGNAPANFGRIRLSAKIGTNSPESIVNIESGVIVGDSLKVVVAWQFFDGFWMFDGVRIWKISAPDIDSFFDPDHADYIPHAYLDQTYGEYDYASQTVRWAVYSGSGATTPTKVIVMHFPSLHFGIFDYATDLDAMLSVVNNKYYLVAGGYNDGRFYQLDTGLTDLLNGVATAVDAYIVTRDEFVSYSEGTRQRLMSIWYEAQTTGGQIELDEYPDGSKTPQNILKANMSVRGKLFGAIQRTLKLFGGQKTSKFRIRNRSKNARMKLLGGSTTIDGDRVNE
jgi:hypothetical protein